MPVAVERLRRLARELDARWNVPGTPIRFGWDAVLGLVPGLGDAVPLLLGAAVPLVAARLGVPAPVVARMVANLAIDALVGTMPLLGDAFDVVWRAHRRNVRLLEAALADPHRAGRRSTAWWLLGIGLVAGVVLLLATALVVGVVEVVRRVPLW